MDGLENYKAKLHSLGELVKKMEAGALSISELSELEKLTRQLHERSIILKYKAFENKVKEEAPVESVVEEEKPLAEDEEVVTGGLDCSLFDEPEEELTVDPMEEAKPVVEKVTVETQVEDESLVEVKESVVENQIEEVNIDLTEPLQSDEAKGCFLDRLKLPDESVSTQFSGAKLDSLSGAFGVNEKMRFVRELFAGSSDLFSEAIIALDGQSSIGDASLKVEELAFSNSWDLEEDTVLEFMSIIKRRYA